MTTSQSSSTVSVPDFSQRVRGFALCYRDLWAVLGTALAFRVLFAFLISDTYDYDEFVILLLGRDYAHGLTPYVDFRFFHPPGVLVLMRALQPVLSAWWPVGRGVSIAADSATAGLVWCAARAVFERRTALAAGILYAASPVALVSAARVGQDPFITLLGFAGLTALVRSRSWQAAAFAGLCLGLATWIKYPALYFLPVYVLAAPRRAPAYLAAGAVTLLLCFVPFREHFHELYAQTVTFQRTRWHMALELRLQTAALYWIAANPLAVVGILGARRFGLPLWAIVGFLLGGVFIFTSQVYYHYFVPVVPFAAILAAPVVVRLLRQSVKVLVSAGLVLLVGWAAVIDLGGSSPLYLTAAHVSTISPTVTLLDRFTQSTKPVLADRYEYAYLARRPALAHYFWNVGPLITARELEKSLPRAGAIVMSHGASSGYPAGFTRFLNRHYPRIETGTTTIWLPTRPARTARK